MRADASAQPRAMDAWRRLSRDLAKSPDGIDEWPNGRKRLLPPAFREYIESVADGSMWVDPGAVAIPLIVAAAAALGIRVRLSPSPGQGWREPPILWGMVVAPSSAKKTSIIRAGTDPLARVESDLHAEWERTVVYDDAGQPDKPEPVITYTTATPEGLRDGIRDRGDSVLLSPDELTMTLDLMTKSGREGERAFMLSANGGHTFTERTRGRGVTRIERCGLNLVGTIQPSVIGPRVQAARAGKREHDGLLARFGLLAFVPHRRGYRSRRPNDAERTQRLFDRVAGILRRLADWGPDEWRARGRDDDRWLPFSPEAQDLFDAWDEEQRERQIDADAWEEPTLLSHLGKYPAHVCRLSLVFHAIEQAAQPGTGASAKAVGADSLRLALEWLRWLEPHARHFYGGVQPGHDAAEILAMQVDAGDIADGTTVRDIYRAGRKGLSKRADVLDGLRLLEGLGVLAVESTQPGEHGGRPSQVVRIPTVKTPAATPQVSSVLQAPPDDSEPGAHAFLRAQLHKTTRADDIVAKGAEAGFDAWQLRSALDDLGGSTGRMGPPEGPHMRKPWWWSLPRTTTNTRGQVQA